MSSAHVYFKPTLFSINKCLCLFQSDGNFGTTTKSVIKITSRFFLVLVVFLGGFYFKQTLTYFKALKVKFKKLQIAKLTPKEIHIFYFYLI